MTTLYLLNSALCYAPGRYEVTEISPEQAKELYSKHSLHCVSAVGYQNTADYLSRVLGEQIQVSRKEIEFADGDRALVCRLRYRMLNPEDKKRSSPVQQEVLRDEDVQLLWIAYTAKV